MPTTRPLLFARTFYFLFYAAWAFLLPFLALHYQSLGFTGSQIGLLASIPPLTTLFAAPFWGGLADASRRHRLVLAGTIVGAMTAVFALMQARQFWFIAPIVAIYAFFSAPIIPLIDNTVLALLGSFRHLYGKQRMWGAVGWGVAGPLAGWLTGLYGLSWSFIGYITLAGLALITTVGLPIQQMQRSMPFWHGVRHLLANRRWFLFLLVVFISGVGLAMVSNYLFLYLEDLGASRSMMGWALAIATISEIPVLFFSGWMICRWGTRGLLIISLVAYVVRAFGYSIAQTPEQAMIFQLLHGLSFSAMLVAGVSLAGEIAPEGMGATAQGLFTSTMSGFGGITGALIGGMLLDRVGPAAMYRWAGLAVLCGLLLFLVAERLYRPGPQQAAHS